MCGMRERVGIGGTLPDPVMATSRWVQWQEYSRPEMLVMCGQGFGDATDVIKVGEVRGGIPGRQ